MKSTVFSLLALSTGALSLGVNLDLNLGTGAVSQITDGQVQAPTGTPVSQISDGQVQAPATTVAPETPILVTSTIKETSVHTISECATTVTNCPYTTAPVTTTYINEYTTICPVTATETSAPATSETPTEIVSTVVSTKEHTISSCAPEVTNCPYKSSGSISIATTVPVSSASVSVGIPASTSSPVSLPGELVSTAVSVPVESTATPAPVLSTITISTCIPTVITSVITVNPSASTPAVACPTCTVTKVPVASTGVIPVGPKNSTIPYTSANSASSQIASGLLIAAGLAVALL